MLRERGCGYPLSPRRNDMTIRSTHANCRRHLARMKMGTVLLVGVVLLAAGSTLARRYDAATRQFRR